MMNVSLLIDIACECAYTNFLKGYMFLKESEDNTYTCKHAYVKCCLATKSFSKINGYCVCMFLSKDKAK